MADFLKTNAGTAGTFIRAGGQLAQGSAAARAAGFEAKGLRRGAIAARAMGSREAAESWREVRQVQSRARAVSAASGGGVATDVIADIEAEGEHRALTALFAGEEQAKELEQQAGATEYAGGMAQKFAGAKALGGLAEQFPTMWEKYGGDWSTWAGGDDAGSPATAPSAGRPRARPRRFQVVRGSNGQIDGLDLYD